MSKFARLLCQKVFRQKHSRSQLKFPRSEMSGEALAKLRDLGYGFNKAGELRKLDEETGGPGDEPFVFEISQSLATNQAHYERLAEQIPEIVYDLLEKCGLKRTYVPLDQPPERSTFIFTQPEKLSKSKKLLVTINGSGYVLAGQWARSLIINNSLDHGSQLPYIKRAQELSYDILVTNTNDNTREIDGKEVNIKQSATAIQHARYVFKNIVIPSEPEAVAIVAHSYGGTVTMDLAENFPEFFKDKVFAVAFTDSVHYRSNKIARETVCENTRNWVTSSEPLDTVLKSEKGDVQRVSAGHTKHEWTSYSAFESVFKFLEEKYDSFSESKKQQLDS